MRKLFVNTGNSPMYVGSVMIPPGEQDMVEVPDEVVVVAPVVAATLAELVGEELKKPVRELLAALPQLHLDTLTMMQALEQTAKKPRASLLAALGEELLRRAATHLDGAAGASAGVVGGSGGDGDQAQGDGASVAT